MDDLYGYEFNRRLKLLGLNDSQIADTFSREKQALEFDEGLLEPWYERTFFEDGTKLEDLPEPDSLTLSELVLISDDANAIYSKNHHQLSKETREAVTKSATETLAFGGGKYAIALRGRVYGMGWTKSQMSRFIRNECLITERLKWGRHEKEAWTSHTV